MRADVYWRALPLGDSGWNQVRCLYAYLSPHDREVLYLGKSWGAAVRGRWNSADKDAFWDDLERERGIMNHAVMLGEIVLASPFRLTSQLLSDVESLLINKIQPWGNIQACASRISRPGLEVCCAGAWPLRSRVFRDD